MTCAYRADTGGRMVRLICTAHDRPHPCPHDDDAPVPRPRGRREHIARSAPPWRALLPGAVLYTECGKPTGKLTVVTREELVERVREHGRQVLETVCRTCRSRTDYTARWHDEPGGVITRDAESAAPDQLKVELRALAELAAAHADQFRDLVAGLGAAVELDKARAERERRSRATTPRPTLIYHAPPGDPASPPSPAQAPAPESKPEEPQ